MQPLLAEFRAIVHRWNLANILGICSLKQENIDGPVSVEFTSGRANITLPFDVAPDDGFVVDAMWQFSSRSPDSSVHEASMAQGMSQDLILLAAQLTVPYR